MIAFGSITILLIDFALYWRSERNELLKLASDTEVPKIHISKIKIILIIGDSIIANFPFNAFNANDNIIIYDKGVEGDLIEQILERYQSISNIMPHDIIIFEGGINNILSSIMSNFPKDVMRKRIIDSYWRMIKIAINNGKKAMVLEILPVTHKYLFPFMKIIQLPTMFNVETSNKFIDNINSELRIICKENGAHFIETHYKLENFRGELKREYASTDGYHININGYKILSELILAQINNIKCDQIFKSMAKNVYK